MIENEAKGWYGNYSIIGRNIVQRFQLLLKKDEILSGKTKKIHVDNFFFPDEKKNLEENKKYKNGKDINIDIFSENYDKLKKQELKLKNKEKKSKQSKLCTSKLKFNVKEKYKYHQFHHSDLNELNDKIIKEGLKKSKVLANYNPKMSVIWKKSKSGPHWNLLRARSIISTSKDSNKKKNEKKIGFYLTHKIILSNTVTMDKQTKRGILPTFYDLRIRTDKAFIPREKAHNISNNYFSRTFNDENNSIKNKNSLNFVQHKMSKSLKKSKNLSVSENNNKYLNTYSNSSKNKKFPNQDNFNKNINSEDKINLKVINLKKNLDKSLNLYPTEIDNKNILNHTTIDFSKTLPRNDYYFLKKEQLNHPIFNPSYKLIEPRCITMVSYSKKRNSKSALRKFKGVDPHIFFNPDKVINKVNNHKEAIAPNFNIMAGRDFDSGPLPSFMVKLFDRKSLETINNKGLKMNNYANVDFQKNYSTFYPKKSFNKLINYTLLKNDKESIDEELKMINKEIPGCKKLEKLIDEYNADINRNNDYMGNTFDAITFKTFKRNIKNNKTRNKKNSLWC